MPFAQVHYPFENEQWFDSHSPADFIVEYIGQTRGWFYVMHVLSTAIFDRPAFTSVLSHGIVLGSDGQKMSKSLRNYPDVNEVFDRDGADAMRWFLMSSSVIRGGNISVTEEAIRAGVREFLLPMWSTYYFFALYANAAASAARSLRDGHRPPQGTDAAEPLPEEIAEGDRLEGSRTGYRAAWRTDSSHVLDRYLLAKTRRLIQEVTADLEALDSPMASAKLRDFADVLTNWYVRRSRDRFWAGDDGSADWRDAFDTLYTVLETVLRVAAPLIPLVAEMIWKGLTGGRSVHLEDWPDESAFPADDALVSAMDRVREIASAGLALRKSTGHRVRLPLSRLTVVGDSAGLAEFSGILRDELNVKDVAFAPFAEGGLGDFGITRRLSVNARALGPRVGKDVQRIIQASKSGDWSVDGGAVTAGGTVLLDGEFELVLESADPANAVAFLDTEGFVVLDTATTPELEAEGLARDIIRAVQDTRRSAGLDVSDRIDLRLYFASAEEAASVAAYASMVSEETLAPAIEVRAAESFDGAFANLEELAAVQGTGDAFRAVVEAGLYANTGAVLVELSRQGEGIDV
jgi:isoleucyl-tRNA synthetase